MSLATDNDVTTEEHILMDLHEVLRKITDMEKKIAHWEKIAAPWARIREAGVLSRRGRGKAAS